MPIRLQFGRFAGVLALTFCALAASGCSQRSGNHEWIAQEVYRSLQASQKTVAADLHKSEDPPADRGLAAGEPTPPTLLRPPKQPAGCEEREQPRLRRPEGPASTPKPGDAAAPKTDAAPLVGEVRLTLTETIRIALQNNHDIQVAGYQPPEARLDLIAAEAVFDPSLFATSTAGRTDRPTQSQLEAGFTATKLIQDTWSFQAGLKQKVPTGGTFAIYQASDYLNSNSTFVLPNPQYATRLAIELGQPLLRGAGIEYNEAPIIVANLNAEISFQDFHKAVADVVASVVNAYWQLAFDLDSVRVAQVSLDLAREVLRRETARRQLGASAETDFARAQAAVAIRRADLLRAQNQARESMDRLKLVLGAPNLPLAGDARVIPVEPPRYFVVDINRSEAISTALSRRPELARARGAIAINHIRVRAADNERLPKLDATLKYNMNGLGTTLAQGMEMQDISELITWSAGLEFEWPIGNRAADAMYRKRLLELDQSVADLERLANQATQEVNASVRAVLLARQEVEATLEAKDAAGRTVRGEQQRFELGEITNDELLRAQETLARAERDYLQALLNFNLGLVSLARAEGALLDNEGIEVFQPEATPERPRPLELRLGPKGPLPPPGVTVPGPARAKPGSSEALPGPAPSGPPPAKPPAPPIVPIIQKSGPAAGEMTNFQAP